MTAKHKHAKEPTLSELLATVATEHFGRCGKCSYKFCLANSDKGWSFKVTDNWTRWCAANKKFTFGPHPTPEAAVQAFLAYVREHRIDVSGLQD